MTEDSRALYTPNALNQYTAITHPDAFEVLGRAPINVGVTLNGQAVTRRGEFWRREVGDLPNALAAVWQSVQVIAVDLGAGPEGADLPARRSGHRFVSKALEVPAYDLDGNLLADARWTYQWDAENRLVEVSTGPAALASGVPKERFQYVYDSRSRRIGRTVASWSTVTSAWVLLKSERFVYDQWNVVAVVDAAGAPVQRYAWGNDISGTPQGAGGVGGLLAAADLASGRSWAYAYDGNGNVSAVVDLADGTKVGRYEYDAFGRTIAQWGDEELAEENEYRFSTKPLEGTGLYYYGFRYYMPETGRWAGRDPIGERGGVNLYGFVGNDGVGEIDVLGMVDFADYAPSFKGAFSSSGALSRSGNDHYPVNYAEGMVGYIYLYYLDNHKGTVLRSGPNDRMYLDDTGLVESLMRNTQEKYFDNEILGDIQGDARQFIQEKETPGKFHGGRDRFGALAWGNEGALQLTLQNYTMSWEYTCSVGCSATSSSKLDSTLNCEFKFEVVDKYDFARNPGGHWIGLIPQYTIGLGGTPYWVLANWKGTGNGTINKGIEKSKFVQFK